MNRIALGLIFMLSTALASAEAPGSWVQKVDPALMQSQNGSNTEFLLVLTERADVSGASGLESKKAKGEYVFEQLSQTAARTQSGIIEQLKAAGAQYRSFWIDNMLWVQGDLTLIQALAERTEVARIITNSNSRLPANLDIPLDVQVPTNVEWSLAALRVTNVWALGYNGQGVVIGGQDTGYQWDHPALINSYRGWDGTNVDHNYNWHDAIHSTTNYNRCGVNLLAPCDDVGHGTHTMGTMVGDDGGTNHIGVAPGAKWIGCRNMNSDVGSVASYLECFQWFLAPTDLTGQNPDPSKAPDVINNSWACLRSEGCTDPAVLLVAVENVRAAGIVVVAGAGNYGPGCSTILDPPAIYGAVLTVGGLTIPGWVDPYSGRGPVVVDGSNRLKPNVCAPGDYIRSSYPTNTYDIMGGTSMASAHASGLVALVLSAHPELRGQVDALTRLVEQTAVPLTNSQICDGTSSTNVPNVYGVGAH